MPWLPAYAAFCAEYPYDAAEFKREVAEKARTTKPIQYPEKYFRNRIAETLRGDRPPAGPPKSTRPTTRQPSGIEREMAENRMRVAERAAAMQVPAGSESMNATGGYAQ